MKDTFGYNYAVKKLRRFFQDERGFIEVPTQSRQSILAACEDPETITQYIFSGTNYPLPQTGQMWLETEILSNNKIGGVFCISTSYRNEPNPIAGRHDKIFPMFEFESRGTVVDLKNLLAELTQHLGFDAPTRVDYEDACKRYNVETLEANHETQMQNDFGNSISLELFPQRSHPFWNMKRSPGKENLYNKIDILLHGMETFGCAERSCNTDEMEYDFFHVSNGDYAKLLFNHFSEERVLKELHDYLSLPMTERFGGGIGVTRTVRALKLEGVL